MFARGVFHCRVSSPFQLADAPTAAFLFFVNFSEGELEETRGKDDSIPPKSLFHPACISRAGKKVSRALSLLIPRNQWQKGSVWLEGRTSTWTLAGLKFDPSGSGNRPRPILNNPAWYCPVLRLLSQDPRGARPMFSTPRLACSDSCWDCIGSQQIGLASFQEIPLSPVLTTNPNWRKPPGVRGVG